MLEHISQKRLTPHFFPEGVLYAIPRTLKIRIRQSLGIAKEVQQHLLPSSPPEINGLDIAGRSIYCEEIGGDYFDFLPVESNGTQKVKIVVGDEIYSYCHPLENEDDVTLVVVKFAG